MKILRSIHLSHLLLVVGCGIVLSSLLLWCGAELVSDQFFRKMGDFVLLHARFIQSEGPSEVSKQAKAFDEMRKDLRIYIFDTWIVDEKGEVLYRNAKTPPPISIEKIQLGAPINSLQHVHKNIRKNIVVVRVSENPNRYAIYEHLTGRRFLFFAIGAQIVLLGVIVILTAFLSTIIIILYSRRKSLQAHKVIQALEGGDLKARFQINKLDEVGSLMERFNTMAEKVESLVLRLKDTDLGRKKLLQEMSHDLRSPITSLRTSVELIASGKVNKTQLNELVGVAEQEISVLSDFVEDLFFLSVADEPQYRVPKGSVEIVELIRQQIHRRKMALHERDRALEWNFHCEDLQESFITADARLLRRLFANIFDNISRFARKNVWVTISKQSTHWEIKIVDDGPGFTQPQLKGFGNRQPILDEELGRAMDTSFGLGSVIVKTIAFVHGWQMHVSNQQTHRGTGAQFLFRIPLEDKAQAAA